jgi:hypothetical protein
MPKIYQKYRLLVSPRKLFFLSQPMNLIDLFTVLPFFCELGLSTVGITNAERLKDIAGLLVKIIRLYT